MCFNLEIVKVLLYIVLECSSRVELRVKVNDVVIIRPTSVRIWHKAIFRWVRSQGQNPQTTGSSKNASVPVGIPLFGTSHVPDDKTNSEEEG